MASLEPQLQKFAEIIKQSEVIEDGTPTRYRLKPKSESHDESEPYRKMTFGERDTNKPHKIILMVGETGTGKTTLINVMINYMLGVQREDKVWFEFTDDQSDRTSVHSQTSIITVYGFYPQESPIHLTIIDTPGYGDTNGENEKDQKITKSLFNLCKSEKGIHEIDAVCLVIKSTQTRLSDRQIYIFDAVQSLFGSNIAENIVLLFTHSRGAIPKNALKVVKEAKIKCAVNDENQPVYFMFDNCQSKASDKKAKIMQEQSWKLSFKGINNFFNFFDNINSKSLEMTRDVLQQQVQFEEKISKIQSHIQEIVTKQRDLEKAQNDLNTKFEDSVSYKEKVDIDPSLASVAMCCTVCEENCHYPGCWWAKDPSWCCVMKNNHCRVCSNKCHYSKHVKEAKIYVTKKKINEHVNSINKIMHSNNELIKEMQELEKEKIKLLFDAFYSVKKLLKIVLNADSLIILLNLDFLIENLKEIKEHEKAKKLEDIKKRAGEKKNRVV